MTVDVQLNWLVRYRPILKQLKRAKGSVLEVGSGPMGISILSGELFVGCDSVFEQQPVPTMSAVIGSALHLPFASREFQVVIASDVLEHIPADSRAEAVRQLIRVSRRWVIIGVPCGSAAEWADRWLAHWLTYRGRSVPGWLVEHQTVGLPGCDYVDNLLKQQGGVTWTMFPNENAWMHLLFMIFDGMGLGGRLIRHIWRRWPGLLTCITDASRWRPWYRRIYVVERVDG